MTALAGLVIAALLWWGLKAFSKAKPSQVARLFKITGGLLALAVAGLMLLRGRIDMAALAGGAGAWLMGWSAVPPGWMPSRWTLGSTRRTPGSASRVRSAFVEMVLDHDTGAMSGTVLAGVLAGRPLEALDEAELAQLRDECLARDVEGLRLVEAYLDRRFPAWREDAERDADRRGRPELERGAMSEKEAHEILGLQPGASSDAIRAAHRTLMKRLHPDQGGSTYLASRVNQAKDLLLDRHR